MDMIARLIISLLAVSSLVWAETPVSVDAVVNAASLAPGPLAPGTLAVITGSGLSEGSETASANGTQPLPTKLGGVQVFLYGAALPLLSVSPTEVQFQLPYHIDGFSTGMIYVRTDHSDGSTTVSKGTSIEIESAAPGIYAFGGAEPRAGLILHAQASGSSPAGAPVTAANPAHAGETLLVWATGLGDVQAEGTDETVKAGLPLSTSDAPVKNTVDAGVNGRSVSVVSAVLPQGAVGVYEVRIQLPDDLLSDPKAQLSLMEDGRASNTVLFPLQGSNR